MIYFSSRFYFQDAARQERQAKDRLAREKDVLIAEKFTLEQSLAVGSFWVDFLCFVCDDFVWLTGMGVIELDLV